MTRRALGGFGAAVVLALALVGFLPGPAQARTPTLNLDSPANGATLTSPATVVGQAAIQNGHIDWVRITVDSIEGHPVPSPMTVNGNTNSNQTAFSWSPPLAYNGQYKVTVLAQGTDNLELNGPEYASLERTFTLNVAPSAPTGVKAAVNQTKRTITISWLANPEPDIVGYGVYRKDGDTFVERKITTKDQKSYTDDLGSLPAGTYSYQVFAARSNAAGDDVLVSGPAATSAKVTSAPPPPPTTSTVAGGGSGATTTTTAPGTKPPALATRGKTDLSGFAALLPTGSAKLPAAPRSGPAPDPGFSEDLPFGTADGNGSDSANRDDSEQAIGGQTLASSNDEQPSALRFMAAGLLVTVVLMHLLWLREEVNREPLPAIDPEEPADS